VLPGLHELFLQGLRPEHCIATPLEHARFLSGSLRDILQQTTTVSWVLSILRQIDYSRASTTHLHPLLGLPHCFQVPCYHRRVDYDRIAQVNSILLKDRYGEPERGGVNRSR
jgi:hypothetical protein